MRWVGLAVMWVALAPASTAMADDPIHLSLSDPSVEVYPAYLQAGVDLGVRGCASAITESGSAAALGKARYILSRDGGVTWEAVVSGAWITGVDLDQAMTAEELSAVIYAYPAFPELTLRIKTFSTDGTPPLDELVFEPCSCGDGFISWFEACDDGNTTDGDGCDSTCALESGYVCLWMPSICGHSCGNELLNAGEGCDDGNEDPGDGCSPNCAVEVGYACHGMPSQCAQTCGNGVVDPGEECDDGNSLGGDGCSASCRLEWGWDCSGDPLVCHWRCGNGVLDAGETCDDGNNVSGDGCSAWCQVEPGETCVGEPSVCHPWCGNRRHDAGEACDDGNKRAGDGCSPTCSIEPGWVCVGQPSKCHHTCGNGKADFGEQCDDGNEWAGDGCSPNCAVERDFSCSGEPSQCTSACGDGIVASNEACDDGNDTDGDGCNAFCQEEPGYVCTGEPSTCLPTCGDGVLDAGETCDDGNLEEGDGCGPTCHVEAGYWCSGQPSECQTVCGDGYRTSTEDCDDGNDRDGDGCNAQCAVESGWTCTGIYPTACEPTCGDGVVVGDEQCDDGNTRNGDGCSSKCKTETPAQNGDVLLGTAMGGSGCSASGGAPAPLLALAALLGLARILGRRRRLRATGRGPLVVCLVLAGATSARAQGLDLQRYAPSIGPDDFASLPSTTPLRSPVTSLSSSLTRKPLVVMTDSGEFAVVAERFEVDLGVGLPLPWQGMDLFVSLPFVPYQHQAAQWRSGKFVVGESRSLGLGTPRVGVALPLLELWSQRCSVVAHPQLGVPLGSDTLSGIGVSAAGLGALGCRLGRFAGSAMAGVELASSSAPGVNGWGASLAWGAGLSADVGWDEPDDVVLALEVNGAGLMQRPFTRESERPVEALASARYRWKEGATFVAGLGTSLVSGYGAPAWRAFLGARWELTEIPWPSRSAALAADLPPLEEQPIMPQLAEVLPKVVALEAPGIQSSVLGGEQEGDGPAVPEAGGNAETVATAVISDDGEGDTELPRNVSGSPGSVRMQRTVFFAIGGWDLRPRARTVLEEVARRLASHPELALRVEGHADGTGRARDNVVISSHRAKAVRDYLIARGISPSRVQIVGRGAGAQQGLDLSDRDMALARRAQLLFVTK